MSSVKEKSAEEYYKKFFGYTKARRHQDCGLTWDQVITETEDFAKERVSALSQLVVEKPDFKKLANDK